MSTPVNDLFDELSDEIRELLHPHVSEDARLVQKGLMLYRQGMVGSLHIDDKKITATVQDVTPCKVLLDFSFVHLSECSCPHEGLCRHQMAVFFAGYSSVGSVGDWVEEWREPMKEQKSLASWGLQTAKDLVKAAGVVKPDYDRWVHSFEESFDAILSAKRYSSPYLIAELYQIYERRIKASAPVEQEWRLLYEMVGIVVSFKKLAVLSETLGHTEEVVKRAYLHLFHNLIEDADEIVVKIGVLSLPFAFDEFIAKLKDEAFDLLTAAQGLEYERIYLYRLLWTQFFKKKAWQEEELGKIKHRLKESKETDNHKPLLIAGVHQAVLLQDDERALGMLGEMDAREITPYMLDWIDLLTQMKAWKRVGPWIDLFLQKLKGYLEAIRMYHTAASFTRTALKAIEPYCTEMGKTDVYERAMQATLPYSFVEYEFMLFDRGLYDKWGELQAFIGLNFSDLPKDRVKMIEKEQPEVLLAMLHQSALNEINQKNRQSYKIAVRHLKKLRTLYKKAKRTEDWQYFLNTLIEKTKRLRAFHEECRRGKLFE